MVEGKRKEHEIRRLQDTPTPGTKRANQVAAFVLQFDPAIPSGHPGLPLAAADIPVRIHLRE
jgi:hypothetical protein